MQASRRTWTARGLTLAWALAAMIVTAPGANAQGVTVEEDNLPDAVLAREILKALGLRSNQADIEYRERSPLVVPPVVTLPPPETKTVAERNPEWPIDQDVRRKREAAVARANAQPFEIWRDAKPLGPAEMAPGRGRAPAGSVSGPIGTPNTVEGRPQSPSALGYIGGIFDGMFAKDKPEATTFTGEPPRTALIEPPAGYQTPSPTQPYGTGKRKNDAPLYNPEEMR